jgi:uncharacterized protein (TIGR04255 family)
MFSHQPRCIYRKNQLGEVICQLRFPRILTIGTTVPAPFQEAIRQEFPRFSVIDERPRAAVNLPAAPAEPIRNYQFTSQDGVWRVNLTDNFLSLTCSRYTDWEHFAKMLDKPLAAFIKLYQPAFFQRIGLRYLNFFSRQDLDLEGMPFRELIAQRYLGILAEPDLEEAGINRCTIDAELAIAAGCRAKIHAGPGRVRRGGKEEPELKFVLDLDLSKSGDMPVSHSAGILQTLHDQAFPIFRGASTTALHSAMEPESL